MCIGSRLCFVRCIGNVCLCVFSVCGGFVLGMLSGGKFVFNIWFLDSFNSCVNDFLLKLLCFVIWFVSNGCISFVVRCLVVNECCVMVFNFFFKWVCCCVFGLF